LGVIPTNIKKDFNFVIENKGTVDLELTGNPNINLITDYPEQITLTQPVRSVLAKESTIVFTVSATIHTVNEISAKLTIKSNDVKNGDFNFNIKIKSDKPVLNVRSEESLIVNNGIYDFGFVDLYDGKATKIYIGNKGTSELFLNGINSVILSGDNSNDFSIIQPSNNIIEKDRTADFTITLKPTTKGIKRGVLTFETNDPENQVFKIILTGNVVTAPKIEVYKEENLLVNNSELDFGEFAFGSESLYFNFVIKNTGSENLILTDTPNVMLSGNDTIDFEIIQPTSNTIEPKLSVSFKVKFSPKSLGIKNSKFNIVTNDPITPVITINLKGTSALKPEIGIFQESTEIKNLNVFDCGSIKKDTIKTVTFSIKNKGAENLLLTNVPYVTISGDGTYSVASQPVKNKLNTDEVVSFSVKIQPTSTGVKNATVLIESNDYSNPEFRFNLKIEAKENMLGKLWTRAAATTPFIGRTGMKLIEFQGRLWAMGGYVNSNYKNDIWVSDNGIDWTEAVSDAPWAPRSSGNNKATHLKLFIFKNRLWLCGGNKGYSSYFKDMWVSDDGMTWEKTYEFDGLPNSYIIFDDKLWIIDTDTKTFYSSEDGLSWVKQVNTESNIPTHGVHFLCYTENNKIYMYNGYIYKSNDIFNWESTGERYGLVGYASGYYSDNIYHFRDVFCSFYYYGDAYTYIYYAYDLLGPTSSNSIDSKIVSKIKYFIPFNNKLFLIGDEIWYSE